MKAAKVISLLLSIFMIFSSVGCDLKKSEEPELQAKSYYDCFDTVSVVFSYCGDEAETFEKNCGIVSDILTFYHRQFDIYYEYSGINNLMTVNKNAGISPVEVAPELIDFLLYAKDLYTLTSGKTNIAIGAVTKLWHDAREYGMDDPENAYIPSAEALDAAGVHCDINNLIIDREASTVFITDKDMQLDVGAVGKGYATEKAAQALIKEGVSSYVLNIGGNIRAIGTKVNGEGWITGITNPDKQSDETFVQRAVIKDTSLVTSGDYERYYTVNGEKYHHIIDPETKMPAQYFSSISIFTEDSALADALSTALFCLSYEDGLKLIESIGNVDALWVYRDGTVKMTDGIVLYENDT